jgi:inorganic pyrophosphatase
VAKVDPFQAHIKDLDDIPQKTRDRIKHFFEHYKDLEEGKWVKVIGWGHRAEAEEILATSLEAVKAKA